MKANLMEQFKDAKAKHPGMILLFRMGDFYEMIGEDASLVAKLLGLTVMQRSGEALAGFPYHCLETYLHKILNSGHRVAICEEA